MFQIMNNNSEYKSYFMNHYKMTYSAGDIAVYRRWFVSQWEYIQRRIHVTHKHRVLEIGSGLGGFYSFLPNSIDYTGLELDSSAVKFAKSYFKLSIFKNTSIEEYTKINPFDYVFAFEVLEHLNNPIKCIQHIHSLLKRGAKFVGTSPFPYPKNIWADTTHKYVLHPENWKKLFMEAGFQSVTLTPMSYAPFVWRINPKLNIRFPFYIQNRFFVSTCLIIAKA